MIVRAVPFALLLMLAPGRAHADAWLYEIDPVHTQITFFVDHMGFSRSSGRAYGASGHFLFDRNDWPSACVVVSVPVERIGFGDAEWDERMRRDDFFDAERFNEIRFHSTGVTPVGRERAQVEGILKIRDVERPASLDVTLNRTGMNLAAGRNAAGFSARLTLKRSDFGMTAYLPRVGDEVEVMIEVEGWRQPRSPLQTPRCRVPGDR